MWHFAFSRRLCSSIPVHHPLGSQIVEAISHASEAKSRRGLGPPMSVSGLPSSLKLCFCRSTWQIRKITENLPKSSACPLKLPLPKWDWIGDSESRVERFRIVRFESRDSNIALSIDRMPTCSLCHLYFVKEFPRFGRKISAKIG